VEKKKGRLTAYCGGNIPVASYVGGKMAKEGGRIKGRGGERGGGTNAATFNVTHDVLHLWQPSAEGKKRRGKKKRGTRLGRGAGLLAPLLGKRGGGRRGRKNTGNEP